jgi:hypothetical protein
MTYGLGLPVWEADGGISGWIEAAIAGSDLPDFENFR